MTHALELDAVSVTLAGRRVLERVALTVHAGEAVALVGRNGAGKSTLVDVLFGLRIPDEGRVQVLGGPPPARDVGLVPQDAGQSLLPWFRVERVVGLPLEVRGATRVERERGFARVRELVDPERRIDPRAPCHALSGGERQRVALMRALVAEPRLLVCDEPFGGVDEPSRVRLRAVLGELRTGARPPALLLVSHDATDVAALTTRSVRLEPSGGTTGSVLALEPSRSPA